MFLDTLSGLSGQNDIPVGWDNENDNLYIIESNNTTFVSEWDNTVLKPPVWKQDFTKDDETNDDIYMELEIQRLRDKHYKEKKKLEELEKRLVNKDFKQDVDEYISRLNTFLHTYRFGTEEEYDEIIENYHDVKFKDEQIYVDVPYGGDNDSFDVASTKGGSERRPRERRIYLYNEEHTLVALVSTYALYDGELGNNGLCDEYECFMTSMKNKKAPSFFIEKISKWDETLKEIDIETYLDDKENLQFSVSPLRNPEYTWAASC